MNLKMKKMSENNLSEPTNLSWGKVVDKNSLAQISLPKQMIEEFLKNAEPGYNNILIVFTPRQSILKIDVFPVETKDIIKVQLILTQFSGNTVKQIGQIIRTLDIPKNLFTSGVCIKSNLCVYEAYIEERKLKVSLHELKEKFSEVENVVEVIISKLENEL
jgi:hypothetical protein